MATLEELKAQQERLSREYEAIQAEFSAGKNFTSGQAEIDRERREVAKFRELSEVSKQIRAQEAQTSAGGKTAEQQVNNSFPPNFNNESVTPNQQSTNLSPAEQAKLKNNASGQIDQKVEDVKGGSSQNNTVLAAAAAPKQEPATGTAQPQNTPLISGASGASLKADSAAQKSNVAGTILRNKLHNYTSYTYRLTLFLLTPDDYERLSTNPNNFKPTFALMSSGGGYANPSVKQKIEDGYGGQFTDTAGRHQDFLEDFFIENLNIETVVGLNAKTKASNAVNISFNIVEPYGLTLLDRLLSVCLTTSGNPNYVEQPYLLQIDFLANVNESSGSQGILIDTKKIAIKFLEFKIKPGPSGTEYRVRAIPFNHSAFNTTVASVPVNLSVEGETVGDFFDSANELSTILGDNTEENRIEAALDKLKTTIPEITEEDLERERARYKAAIIYSVKSFPAGYNTYMRNLVSKAKLFQYPPNLVAFNIHPKIANSKIVDEKKNDARSTPMGDRLASYAQTINGPGAANFFKNNSVKSIYAGTDVVNVIDRVVQSSEYIKNQLLQPESPRTPQQGEQPAVAGTEERQTTDTAANPQKIDANKMTNWYKIIPQVKIKEFDKSRNAFSKLVIYNIMPYDNANATHPDFPKTKLNINKCVRTYNYIYTGRNEDIISLDIDFDAAFYTTVTTYNKEKQRTSSYSGADAPVIDSKQNSAKDPVQPPVRIEPAPADTQQAGQLGRHQTAEDQAISSLARSLYTSARGDMLNLKLKIVGDPAFIKQDDIYYSPRQPDYQTAQTMSDNNGVYVPANPTTGQILFDAEQVFVQIIIKDAMDIDDKTGITNKRIQLSAGNYTNGTFSGIYKVLRVVSELSRGKFEQTLELVRMPDDAIEPQQIEQIKSTDAIRIATENKKDANSELATPPPAPAIAETERPDTGLQSTDVAKLKAAANNPPVIAPELNSGNGRPVVDAVPVSAAPVNANQAQNISPQNSTGLSFNDAFRQARKDFGNKPGGVFEWRGKLYQTNLSSEPFVANPKPVYPGANE